MNEGNLLLKILAGLVLAFAAIAIVVVWTTPDVPVVNASSVNVIRVPESFGKTVSISVHSSWTVILFERGYYIHRWTQINTQYEIIWEES